jgi:hypothetical protein
VGIYPNDLKSVCWRDVCTPIFIVALFTIAMISDQQMDFFLKVVNIQNGITFGLSMVAHACNPATQRTK